MKNNSKTILLVTSVLLIIFTSFAFRSAPEQQLYEYKQFSTVESVVAGGIGRSRILTTDVNGQLVEKELKNFYSMVGINFGNIANNDDAIVERVNQYSNDGWELVSVATGSHAQLSNGSSSGGIFITRYMFRRLK